MLRHCLSGYISVELYHINPTLNNKNNAIVPFFQNKFIVILNRFITE
jgi:hypothetical protein